MTVHEVRERVAEIAAIARDDERAHVMEDELHQAVLRAIADGTAEDPQALAAEAIRTAEIEFSRWYA